MLVAAALLDVAQAASTHLLGGLLHRRIERREDPKPALVDALPAEAFDQLAAHLLLEIETEGLSDLEAVGQLDLRLAWARSSPSPASIAPEPTIVCSTTLRRAMARSRLTVGA